MPETFRAPKAVLAEGIVVEGLLSAVDVLALRGATGETGVWASRITAQLEARAADILKETIMEARAEQPYGVGAADPVSHGIMAADAAIDAAQDLLAGIDDPVVSQAYYLVCAADAALDEAQEALGLVDADEQISEGEPAEDVEDELEEMMPVRAQDESELVLVEARKRMAGAERITVDAQIRAADDGGMRIAGYAAMFNREASSLPFREAIAPGAFARSLQSGEPVYLLVNHDMDQLPLASTRSGTLLLSEDDLGLYMEADLDPANPRAAELHSALARGDVDKMSFAFSINEGGETREDGVRVLRDLNLYEVSVVTWPAYDATEVGVRAEPAADALALRRRQIAARLSLRK